MNHSSSERVLEGKLISSYKGKNFEVEDRELMLPVVGEELDMYRTIYEEELFSFLADCDPLEYVTCHQDMKIKGMLDSTIPGWKEDLNVAIWANIQGRRLPMIEEDSDEEDSFDIIIREVNELIDSATSLLMKFQYERNMYISVILHWEKCMNEEEKIHGVNLLRFDDYEKSRGLVWYGKHIEQSVMRSIYRHLIEDVVSGAMTSYVTTENVIEWAKRKLLSVRKKMHFELKNQSNSRLWNTCLYMDSLGFYKLPKMFWLCCEWSKLYGPVCCLYSPHKHREGFQANLPRTFLRK